MTARGGFGREAWMVSVDGLLDAHEVSVRARVEELREQLVAAEHDLERVVITRETLRLVVAGAAAVDADDGAGAGAGAGGVVGSGSGAEPAAVPLWRPGMSEVVLPPVYRQVWLAVCASRGGARAKELCRTLGFATTRQSVEAMRPRLKRLAARGWVVEKVPGLFIAVGSGGGPGVGP